MKIELIRADAGSRCMNKEYARYLNMEQLHERRKRVVRLYPCGAALMRLAAMTRLSYLTVRKAIDLFEARGWLALEPASRVRTSGEGRRLSAGPEVAVRRTICDKRPERLKMQFALWICAAVMHYIERESGVKLSIRATGMCLRTWGVIPQKPIRGANEQRLEAVRRWLEQKYPVIQQAARSEGRGIHWGHETVLLNTDEPSRTGSPRGENPVTLAFGGTREELSMLACVADQGRGSWMIRKGAINHERLVEFLQALGRDGRGRREEVFLILDKLGVDYCEPVKVWSAENKEDIEVLHVPSDSSELEPAERPDADFNRVICSGGLLRTKARFRAAANDPMQRIVLNHDSGCSDFQAPIDKCAA